jgi:hypothetical protein
MEARSKDVVRRFQDDARSWRFKVEAFVAGGAGATWATRGRQRQARCKFTDFIVHDKYFLAAMTY